MELIVAEQAGILPVDQVFYHLSEGGQAPGSLLYESQDEHGKFTGFSIGLYAPSVMVSGKGSHFAIKALDVRGEAILAGVTLPASATIKTQTANEIQGEMLPDLSQVSLEGRLTAENHLHIVRQLLVDVDVAPEYAHLPTGLFGGFAYDFIRQFEPVPRAKNDVMGDDDYCFYFLTRAFIVDHVAGQSYLLSLIPNKSFAEAAAQDIAHMQGVIAEDEPLVYGEVTVSELQSDTDQQTYLQNTEKLIEHVKMGDIFQVQYGRLLSADFSGDAYLVYTKLKTLNPSPYMFYMRDHHGVLLGSSPELNVSVKNIDHGEKQVDIAPIAGTKPRGFSHGKICPELDERYAISLQTDEKELAEHVMLIDLVRNDIASIAKTGTTLVQEALIVKKFSHVQHLVSRVIGILRDDIDALTAYLATMNMGTLTGAPKPMAMQLIAKFEENERGYYGGGFGFVTHAGEMETAIVIRSMRIKNDKLYLRASAGIVADSVPQSEWQETENKIQACVKAVQEAVSHGQ